MYNKEYAKNYYQKNKEKIRKQYRKERNEIIQKLGGKCQRCGSKNELHIHHKTKTLKGAGRGQLRRLRDWKRNINKLGLFCKKCHLELENNHEHNLTKIHENLSRCKICGKFVS